MRVTVRASSELHETAKVHGSCTYDVSYDCKELPIVRGMNQTREHMRALLPHLDEQKLDAACERFRRYICLAAEIVRKENSVSAASLTAVPSRARVKPGQVDPSPLKNTG